MSLVIWVNTEDCDPPHAFDPVKADRIEDELRTHGFDKNKPALIGYPLNGRIQLLSGTHRHEAARRLGILLPVTLWLGSTVAEAWGELEEWKRVMEDTPVSELERWTRD